MTAAFSPTIDAFLLDHHVMSLAVCDPNGPWVASVFYIAQLARHRLLFFTSVSTRHGAALALSGKASAAIAGQSRDISRLCGLQLEGRAMIVEGDEAAEGDGLFRRAFPEIGGMKAPLWALQPATMKLTDNARGFGHKESWQAERQSVGD